VVPVGQSVSVAQATMSRLPSHVSWHESDVYVCCVGRAPQQTCVSGQSAGPLQLTVMPPASPHVVAQAKVWSELSAQQISPPLQSLSR
jgi:hypothetical protein